MRLFLHVGHGKTGSSWLQSWLACNSKLLEDLYGLRYPMNCPVSGHRDQAAALGRFSMGNGYVLDPWLNGTLNPKSIIQLVQGLPSDGALLFSCEQWMKSLPERSDVLNLLANELGVEKIEFWLLVRDPLEHACSLYGQMVKAHGFTGSLADWLTIYDLPKYIRTFLDKYSDINVTHYGQAKDRLELELLTWLGLPLAQGDCWIQPPCKRVNRSLDINELIFLRTLNTIIGGRSRPISMRLVEDLPDLLVQKSLPNRIEVDSFRSKWKAPVEYLNHLLPSHAQLNLYDEYEIRESTLTNRDSSISLSNDQWRIIIQALMNLGVEDINTKTYSKSLFSSRIWSRLIAKVRQASSGVP